LMKCDFLFIEFWIIFSCMVSQDVNFNETPRI
jgi:hypothetical protein